MVPQDGDYLVSNGVRQDVLRSELDHARAVCAGYSQQGRE